MLELEKKLFEIYNLIDKKEYADAKNKIHQLLKKEILKN